MFIDTHSQMSITEAKILLLLWLHFQLNRKQMTSEPLTASPLAWKLRKLARSSLHWSMARVARCKNGLLVSVCCFGQAQGEEVSSAEFLEDWLMGKEH